VLALRAGTQFEAWLSMQAAGPNGLLPAQAERRRCTIVCIHNATAGAEDTKLVTMWANRTPEEARNVLAAPDVTVTNARDKETQLEKIGKLDGEAREAYSVSQARALREEQVAWAQLLDGGFTCARLMEVGCTAAELREGGALAGELKELGCTLDNLKAAGYSAADARAAGYTVEAAKAASFSPSEIATAGFSASEVRRAFAIPDDASAALEAGFEMSLLVSAFSTKQLGECMRKAIADKAADEVVLRLVSPETAREKDKVRRSRPWPHAHAHARGPPMCPPRLASRWPAARIARGRRAALTTRVACAAHWAVRVSAIALGR